MNWGHRNSALIFSVRTLHSPSQLTGNRRAKVVRRLLIDQCTITVRNNGWFPALGTPARKDRPWQLLSLGPVNVPADKLWGAQTQRSLEHFSIGDDLIPREMIPAYATVKKAAALVNHEAGRQLV
jgi:hypothetical protein